MKKLINYAFLLIFFTSFSQNSITISQALNIASKQSMLCERIAKEKIFKATNPNNLNTEQKLGVSLIQFEQNISLLKGMHLPEEIIPNVITLEMLWIGYKKNILDNSKASTLKIMEFHDILLSHSKTLFNKLLGVSEKNNSYPYNTNIKELPEAYKTTNNLKYLSQKISLYYNAYYSNVIIYDANKLNRIIDEIDNSIATIVTAKKTIDTNSIKTNEVKTTWDHLKKQIQRAIDNNFTNVIKYPKPEYVLNETSKLLRKIDLLTRQYKENSEIK